MMIKNPLDRLGDYLAGIKWLVIMGWLWFGIGSVLFIAVAWLVIYGVCTRQFVP